MAIHPDTMPTKYGPTTKRELRLENAKLSAQLVEASRQIEEHADAVESLRGLALDWTKTMRATTLDKRMKHYIRSSDPMSSVIVEVFVEELIRRSHETHV